MQQQPQRCLQSTSILLQLQPTVALRPPALASGKRSYSVLPVPKSPLTQTCHLLHSEAQQGSVQVKKKFIVISLQPHCHCPQPLIANVKAPLTIHGIQPFSSRSQDVQLSVLTSVERQDLRVPLQTTKTKKIKDVPMNTLFVIKFIICCVTTRPSNATAKYPSPDDGEESEEEQRRRMST